MGLSTALVGLLPGYATLGSWAPVLLVLLRFLQGIGIGGEWGGAVLLAVEHAPRGRRGLYAAFPQLGPPVGFSAATGVFWLMSASLDEAAFASWGWRVPFLLSFLLVAVGLVVRLKISETPVFARSVAERTASRAPLAELVRRHPRELLLGAGAMAIVYTLFYASMTYGLSYTTASLGVPRNTMLALSLVACLFLATAIWLSATRSDTDGKPETGADGLRTGRGLGPAAVPAARHRAPGGDGGGHGRRAVLCGRDLRPDGRVSAGTVPRPRPLLGRVTRVQPGRRPGRRGLPLVVPRLQSGFGSASVGWYVCTMAVVSLLCVRALPETKERELV